MDIGVALYRNIFTNFTTWIMEGLDNRGLGLDNRGLDNGGSG